MSPAVVDVVFGRLQSSVADVNELRRQRAQDTEKCGRVVRTIGNAFNQTVSPKATVIVGEENSSPNDFTVASPAGFGDPSANISPSAISIGKILLPRLFYCNM